MDSRQFNSSDQDPAIALEGHTAIEPSGASYVDVLLKDSHATGRRLNELLLQSGERYSTSSIRHL